MNSANNFNNFNSISQFCPLHKDKLAEFFCNCKKIICSSCIDSHSKHENFVIKKRSDIYKVFETDEEIINSSIQSINQSCGDFENNINSNEQCLLEEIARVNQDFFNKVKAKVDNKCKLLVNKEGDQVNYNNSDVVNKNPKHELEEFEENAHAKTELIKNEANNILHEYSEIKRNPTEEKVLNFICNNYKEKLIKNEKSLMLFKKNSNDMTISIRDKIIKTIKKQKNAFISEYEFLLNKFFNPDRDSDSDRDSEDGNRTQKININSRNPNKSDIFNTNQKTSSFNKEDLLFTFNPKKEKEKEKEKENYINININNFNNTPTNNTPANNINKIIKANEEKFYFINKSNKSEKNTKSEKNIGQIFNNDTTNTILNNLKKNLQGTPNSKIIPYQNCENYQNYQNYQNFLPITNTNNNDSLTELSSIPPQNEVASVKMSINSIFTLSDNIEVGITVKNNINTFNKNTFNKNTVNKNPLNKIPLNIINKTDKTKINSTETRSQSPLSVSNKVQQTCSLCNIKFFIIKSELDWRKNCDSCRKECGN